MNLPRHITYPDPADITETQAATQLARLLQLAIRDGKLLASFQIGERVTDVRVFRWSISVDR